MQTPRLIVDASDLNDASSRASIEAAAHILREGGTVAFPTETVYGLGANALRADAVEKIFRAKQRPSWDPLIVHIADIEMLHHVAASVPRNAKRLMDAFWPGPLTLLLPRHPRIPEIVTACRPLVGVRMPQHPVAKELIRTAGVPIAAPSANLFGHTSPTSAQHVADDLDGRIDAILDTGSGETGTEHGLESTVVDAGQHPCVVYRPGAITLAQIRSVCKDAVEFIANERDQNAAPEALPSPGVGIRHYAPHARLVLVEPGPDQARRFAEQANGFPGETLGLMLPEEFSEIAAEKGTLIYRWGRWDDYEELAQRLFAGLRWLDAQGATVILCPLPEAEGIGVAIRDRLSKAARTE
ncbi:L-threonylcarbamoyladenylate synthase [Silvibacterium bohemicum]|uniref:Threonylcarbamoyl-AMP synthase n=1 Tax=Silvibacterium bohemicum TaxID=1577686 RepID=A0A841JWL0_9BACT|nr:L-threonylcarbamoyladenylate synthase [Silvibacterium bohemicum]MBB6142828.1 L-threonylcarbamoyladenylate synthase [Silvibacterium bohemicum]